MLKHHQDLSNTLWAYGTLNHKRNEHMRAINWEVMRQIEWFSPQGASYETETGQMIWNLGSANYCIMYICFQMFSQFVWKAVMHGANEPFWFTSDTPTSSRNSARFVKCDLGPLCHWVSRHVPWKWNQTTHQELEYELHA